MSRQASADPMIGQTRPARSRTTVRLSAVAADALPANAAINRMEIQQRAERELLAKDMWDR